MVMLLMGEEMSIEQGLLGEPKITLSVGPGTPVGTQLGSKFQLAPDVPCHVLSTAEAKTINPRRARKVAGVTFQILDMKLNGIPLSKFSIKFKV